MTQAKGIDLSAWNTVTDWVQVGKAGLSFAFIKATEGNGYEADYKSHWEGAGSIGLLRSNYHFHRAAVSGTLQADYFLKRATKGELPPVVDFEDAEGLKLSNITGATMLDNLRACLERIESAWDCLPIVYSGLWFIQACLNESPNYNPRWLTKYPLWIAHYTHNPDVPPLKPAWWDWKFYQYTSSGQVPGISGRVDMNVFAGTVEELRTWAGIEKPGLTDKQKLDILWAEYSKGR